MISISFKPLTENDLSLLHKWFQKSHVKQFYARDEDYTIDMIRKKYLPRILSPDSIPNFIAYVNNTAIGYIQLYCLTHSLPDGVQDTTHPLFHNRNPKKMAGIDLFIAEEKYLHKGYGSLMLKNFINEYVKDNFTLLVVDPLKTNQQAIHFFERNGFKKLPSNDMHSLHELLVLSVTR